MNESKKRPPWRPTKYDESMPERAYRALCEGGTIAHVAVACDASKRTVYEWMHKHADFSHAIEKGLAVTETLWTDPDFYPEMSPARWIFQMKNRFDWRDKIDNEISGPNKGPVHVKNVRDMSDDELLAIASGSI